MSYIATYESQHSKAPMAEGVCDMSVDIPQYHDGEQVTLRTKPSHIKQSSVSEKRSEHETPVNDSSVPVVMRSKSKPSTHYGATNESVLATRNSSGSSFNSRRNMSMIDVSRTPSSSNRFDDIRKSFSIENKSLPALRQLSALRPLSASTTDLSRFSSEQMSRPFSSSFSNSSFGPRTNKTDYPKTRQKDKSPFQVDILKGIVGIGLKVKVTSEGQVQITEIQKSGPVDKNGQVRVGDYILFVNSTELTGQTDARVQQVLRLLPRGLTKLVISSAVPASETEPRLQLQERNSFTVQRPQQLEKEARRRDDSLSKNIQQLSGPTNEHRNAHIQHVLPLHHISSSGFITASTAESQNMEQVELTTRVKPDNRNQPAPAPKPGNVTEYLNHTSQYITAMPINESCDTYSESTTPVDLKECDDSKIIETAIMPTQNQYTAQDVNTSSRHLEGFESTTDMFGPHEAVKQSAAVLLELTSKTSLLAETTAGRDQVSSQSALIPSAYQSTSPTKYLDKKKLETTCSTISESMESTFKNKDQFDHVGPLRKTVTPSAGLKYRSQSLSSLHFEDGLDESEHIYIKPQPRRSAGYERLQSITKSSRPSTIFEKSGTFVSSTAKLFDAKEPRDKAIPEKNVITKSTAINVKADSVKNKSVNTSIKPVHDRWKHADTSFPAQTFTQVATPPSRSWSRSVSHTVVKPAKVTVLEHSRRNSEITDHQTTTIVSSTNINSALSPRRASHEFHTTPSFGAPTKHMSTLIDQSHDKFLAGRNKSDGRSVTYKTGQASRLHRTTHSNNYQSTPVSLLNSKSLSEDIVHSSVSVQPTTAVAREQYRMSSTSSVQSSFPAFGSEANGEVSNIRKFDELLMEPPYQRSVTDPDDLLLWTSVESGSTPLPAQSLSLETVKSEADETMRPVAAPRKSMQPKESEKENGFKNMNQKETTESNVLKNEGVAAEEIKDTADKRGESLVEITCNSSAETVKDLSSGGRTVQNPVLSTSDIFRDDISSGFTVTNKTVDETEKESKQRSDNAEELGQLFEISNHSTHNASENHKQPLQDASHTHSAFEIENNVPRPNIGEVDNKELIESLIHNSADENWISSSNKEMKQEFEVRSGQQDFFSDQASEIVENMMIAIRNNPDIIRQDEKSTFSIDPASPASSEAEPPPLPGAPPPTIILKDTNLLINESGVIEQSGTSFILERIKENIAIEPEDNDSCTVINKSTSNIIPHVVNTHTEEAMSADNYAVAEEDQATKADSQEPLNSHRNGFHDRDDMRVNSPSPVDMLSEDSGMPADEDQEVATDDAISPPGELADNIFGPDSLKYAVFPNQFEAGLLSFENEVGQLPLPRAATQELQSSIILNVTHLQGAEQFSETVKNYIENDDVRNELPPPLLPTSAPPSIAAPLDVSLNYTEDVASSQTLPTYGVQHMSPEVDLLGDEVPCIQKQDLIQMESVSKQASESIFDIGNSTRDPHSANKGLSYVEKQELAQLVSVGETVAESKYEKSMETWTASDTNTSSSNLPHFQKQELISVASVSRTTERIRSETIEKSAKNIVENTAGGDLLFCTDNIVHLEAFSESQDKTLAIITSKRKWCLRSNICQSPLLVGDCNVSVGANYTEKTLVKALPYSDLTNLIDKANVVLEASSAGVNLILMVIHLHGDGAPLGVDLKHDGGSCFKVSGLKKGSPVLQEGGAKVGDWLLAVDSLWCDQVNKMRFLSRLAKPKHDSLLVFAREEKSVDAKAFPIQESISISVQDRPSANKRQSKPSTPLQEDQLLSGKVPISSLSEVMVPLPDHIQSFTEQVPQLPQDEPPPLPRLDQVTLTQLALLRKEPAASQHSEQVQRLFDQKTLLQDGFSHINNTPLAQHEIALLSINEKHVQKEHTNKLETKHSESIVVSVKNVPVESLPSRPSRVVNREQKGSDINAASVKSASSSEVSVKDVPINVIQLPAESVVSSSVESSTEPAPGVHSVMLIKGATGVGFSLEGGVGSPKGDLPITIKRIFKGGPAEKCGLLKVKDEILEVNGLQFSTMQHYEAWNHLKLVDDGKVLITIRRT